MYGGWFRNQSHHYKLTFIQLVPIKSNCLILNCFFLLILIHLIQLAYYCCCYYCYYLYHYILFITIIIIITMIIILLAPIIMIVLILLASLPSLDPFWDLALEYWQKLTALIYPLPLKTFLTYKRLGIFLPSQHHLIHS